MSVFFDTNALYAVNHIADSCTQHMINQERAVSASTHLSFLVSFFLHFKDYLAV